MNTVSPNPASLIVPRVVLAEMPLSRGAMDELYHFLQYLQFKYQTDLEGAIAILEEEIDILDAQESLAEGGGMPWQQLKQELGLD